MVRTRGSQELVPRAGDLVASACIPGSGRKPGKKRLAVHVGSPLLLNPRYISHDLIFHSGVSAFCYLA